MKKIGDTIARRKVLIEDGSSISFPPLNQRTILFFYPKDNTPGCTAEACSLRDGHREFGELGYEVFGISVDSVSSHHKFIEKHTLPYHLISDADKKMVEEFGVWGKKKFMGREYMGTHRVTYILDEKGVITHRIDKVDTKNAYAQILNILKG